MTNGLTLSKKRVDKSILTLIMTERNFMMKTDFLFVFLLIQTDINSTYSIIKINKSLRATSVIANADGLLKNEDITIK